MRGVVVAGLVVAHAAVAGASPTATLTVERSAGAEACPDTAALGAAIAAQLGRDPFSDEGIVAVTCRFEARDGTLRAAVSIGDAAERVFTGSGSGCTLLADTTALAIAMALEAILVDPPAAPPAPPPPPAVAG